MTRLYFFLFFTVSSLFLVQCTSTTQPSSRQVVSLSGSWSFALDSLSTGLAEKWQEKGIPENRSRIVSVPHSWNAEKGLESYWGKGWYQRQIEVPGEQLLQTTRLQFDGVNHDAVVFVNGQKAGEHLGSGYNRFFIDISPYLREGKNTLTVCVDNSPSRSNIPMLRNYDWSHDGGIYRNVCEIVTGKTAIRNIQITAVPDGDKGKAAIRVFFLDPSRTEASKTMLKATIREENQPTQKQIYQGELKGNYDNGSFTCNLDFAKINPWHFDAPNLYKLTITLWMDGEEKDEYSTVFGFRSIKVSGNRYVLNEEPVRLMGVEWMPGSNPERGMSETSADFDRNLELLKNANCIFTRFHWQQDEYILDWCDRHGLLVQEEIPYWGGATLINDTLLNRGIQHLDEMIDNHFNHPALIAWGIGNELRSHDSINRQSLKKLYEHAKELDSSRLVNYVSNNFHFGYPSEGILLPDAGADFDMMMFNEYFSTWYRKSLDVISDQLDKIAKEYPGKPLTISEWGVCEPVHKGGDARRSSEMVRQIEIYGSKPYVAGAIYFCLNDYRTQMGEDISSAYPVRIHGVCDINLNKKPSYEKLKSVSSPLIIEKTEKKEGKILLTLHGKEGIPSYIVRNYRIEAGGEKIGIDQLRPGESRTFEIKSNAKEIKIVRPTGFEIAAFKAEQD